MIDINDYLLTETITVGQTKEWIGSKNSESKKYLIKLIHHRFYNRYLKHISKIDSGFLKMAVCCLMIEALESFKQGEKNTKKRGFGLKMFKDFFKSESDLFPDFDSIHEDFYQNIRCGILHQAETTNAWRILRRDELLNKADKTINATKFAKQLGKSLNRYTNDLSKSEFDSKIWKNAILKLEDVCENCKPKNN